MKKIFSLIIIIVTFSNGVFAIAGGGKGSVCGNGKCEQNENASNCPADCPNCNTCNCNNKACRDKCGKCNIPIDGGIGILLMMGLAYGTKKVYDGNKKKTKV